LVSNEVCCVFKKTSYCFREYAYFSPVKTPLASWCDGTYTIAEKPRLVEDNVDCVFRSAPFNYIGVDSDGKWIHTTKSLMKQVEPFCKLLFQNVFTPCLVRFLLAKKRKWSERKTKKMICNAMREKKKLLLKINGKAFKFHVTRFEQIF
jgi:hypothetical protein